MRVVREFSGIAGSPLLLDLGADCMGMFTVWQLFRGNVYNLYTFLKAGYTSVSSFQS